MSYIPAPRPTPEERARAVKLVWIYSPLGARVIDYTATVTEIASAIRAAVDEETAALRADLARAHDTIRQLADRVEAQSEALTRRAEGGNKLSAE